MVSFVHVSPPKKKKPWMHFSSFPRLLHAPSQLVLPKLVVPIKCDELYKPRTSLLYEFPPTPHPVFTFFLLGPSVFQCTLFLNTPSLFFRYCESRRLTSVTSNRNNNKFVLDCIIPLNYYFVLCSILFCCIMSVIYLSHYK